MVDIHSQRRACSLHCVPGGQSAVGQNSGSFSQLRVSSLHCVPGAQSAVGQNAELVSSSLAHPAMR